ncbi:hypothetical protein P691DRAFT_705667 [Macrolepiota fuliginosa MF-IS2]|uniref:RING-type domain-containing protein n=1 Tax=Macrolepiota fuliginosa MF-IS2 TaxID=1400762 RepID=A0A9P6C143_9AGAR|nr:hypothetical protein P691DRAFT_705667 [Macrolepiota fuliginosa MF-IS2]
MASMHGIPLLSGPPPNVDSSDACRKCNKEFNIIFTRSRKCNHCGYLYCHSCSDYQALLPRVGPDRGYDPVHVCAHCIELLNMTAAGSGQLRGMSLSKLKSYADAYNINISRAVEKGDIVEAIVRARESNGCLPESKQDYYRKHKVPNPHAGTRPRGFFSRSNPTNSPPPVPPRPPQQSGNGRSRRPTWSDDSPPLRFPQPQVPPPQTQYQYPSYGTQQHQQPSPYGHYNPSSEYQPHNPSHHYNVPPYHPSFPQPQAPPPPPPQETRPPPPPRPNTSTAHRSTSRANSHPSDRSPSQRQRTTSTPAQPSPPPPPPPPPPAPVSPPTLDQLLLMTHASIAALPIGVLKKVLFTNHVNAAMILEKSELVKKVTDLIEDEKKERERQRMAEEAEKFEEEERRRERDEAIRKEQEERRRQEEDERWKERRERHRARVEEVPDGEEDMMEVEIEIEDEDGGVRYGRHSEAEPSASTATPGTPPTTSSPSKSSMLATLERSGLCVICQDEEANIAIVDCGHLAMCRACSELVMTSSKECPLCRTRIVTEARLLRIFKS